MEIIKETISKTKSSVQNEASPKALSPINYPLEENKQDNPDCPSAGLTRDEKGMLYYQLDDFEKLFKYIFI